MIAGMNPGPARESPASAARLVFPLADADRCVKCGLCLPHCPTYRETRHEADSPRGRIALMQGLATRLVSNTVSLRRHLDGCLSCRACEPVCPAKVPYGRLIDAGRAELARRDPRRTRLTRWLGRWLVSATGRRVLRGLLALYRGLGVQALVRRTGLLGRARLARLESLIPEPAPLGGLAQASTSWCADPVVAANPLRAAIFAGCVTDVVEREALAAATTLVGACGWQVVEAPGQTCCGALHLHGGLPGEARTLATRNLAAFAGIERVITTASGCAVPLREVSQLLDGAGARDFGRRVEDVHAFVLREGSALNFAPLPARVAVHLPCTLRNVLKGGSALFELLGRIPEAEIVDLDPSGACCGAAGTYFLTQPEMADRLLQPKLDALEKLAPDLLVSANVGCTLHLAAGLRRSGLTTPPVVHPALLLARLLRF